MDLDVLLTDPPPVHDRPEELGVFGLDPAVLCWIRDRVGPGSRTLETGCGTSAAMFATAGCEHTCVVPSTVEIDRLRAWAADRDVSLDRVRFVAEPSD